MAENVTNISEAKTGGTARMPSRQELSELRRKVGGLQGAMDEARGEMGAMLKDAAEKQNVNKKAFKWVSQILNMDDEKRDAFLSHFDHYRQELGVDEGRTGNLFDPAKAAAE